MKLLFLALLISAKTVAQTTPPDYILKTNGDSLSHIRIEKVTNGFVEYKILDRHGTYSFALKRVARIRHAGKEYEFNPSKKERVSRELEKAARRN